MVDVSRTPAARRESRQGCACTSHIVAGFEARHRRGGIISDVIALHEAEVGNQAVEQLAAKGTVKKAADDFIVEGRMEGASARQLNRAILSALRKVEKKTTLRAEWTSSDNITERFFDYVLKTIGN